MDRLSFWLGFLAATVFWFLYQYIRKLWPHIRELVDTRTAKARQINAIGCEDQLRKRILHRAQGYHLSSSLFSLDEIIIPPRLMAPLPQASPDNPAPPGDIVSKTISYLPEWPEFGANFGIRTMDVELPIRDGMRMAIVGHPGSGKSTALAYLVARILRKETQYSELSDLLPVLIHVSDLPAPCPTRGDLIKPVFDLITSSEPAAKGSQEQAVLRTKISSGRLLLLLDGMDELYNNSLSDVTTYLEALLNQYPQLKIVITLSFEDWDGLNRLGFKPFALSAWTKPLVSQFINQWSTAWVREITPILARSSPTRAPDPILVQNWLNLTQRDLNPLEWTLFVWGTCAGDLRGNAVKDGIESYIKRFQNQRTTADLTNLGTQMLLGKQFGLLKSQAAQPDETDLLSNRLSLKPRQADPEQADPLTSLCKQGFMLERSGDRVAFAHPLIACYLASKSLVQDPEKLLEVENHLPWIGKTLGMRFTASQLDLSETITPLIEASEEPLYYELFSFARWCRDIPPEHTWRKNLITHLLEFLQREMLPTAIRQRSLAALILCADTELIPLLMNFLDSSSPSVVSLAVLGLTGSADNQPTNALIDMLGNPSLPVRQATCLALAAFKTQPAFEALTKVLMQADEESRTAAAEALANDPVQGHPVLIDGSEDEDILIRRACVAGLSRINEPWAIALLSKMRTDDREWIIRNAATQAVEIIQQPDPYLPRPLVKSDSSPWLVAFAARQGAGVPANMPATEMLLYALKNGDEEERLGALEYLRAIRKPEVFQALQQASVCPIHSVRESATNILYELLHSGENLKPAMPEQPDKNLVSTLLERA